MDDKTGDILLEITKQTAKVAYEDTGKPILNPTGKTIGLVPRAIKAALLPVEKWILGREYNLKETEMILEEKLKNAKPCDIETPEAYIAVPTLQYISYCIDSFELRNMYANLLASAMDKVVKNDVHPGFVEIIKQLSPDEAKILNTIFLNNKIPLIKIRYENEKKEGYDIKRKYSDIAESLKCEFPMQIENYLDNLERLGLIITTMDNYLVDETIYMNLENNKYINDLKNIPQEYKNKGYDKFMVKKGFLELTEFGKRFCTICVINKE